MIRQTHLIVGFIILLLLISMNWYGTTELETWSNYIMYPLEYRETGSTPLVTKDRSRYRKPYNYPYLFMTQYPQPGLTFLE
jgi:hypothetical protein